MEGGKKGERDKGEAKGKVHRGGQNMDWIEMIGVEKLKIKVDIKEMDTQIRKQGGEE